MIDVLDSAGNRTGEVLSRREVHRLGKLHRVVHLYLFDKKNNLLLQRRSARLDHYPDMFSISVTGHVDAGECSLEAVKRELKEELGMDAMERDFVFLFSSSVDDKISATYIDRVFCDVYACWIDFNVDDVAFDRHEVSEVKLVSLSDVEQMVQSGTGNITPWCGDNLKQVIPLVKERRLK